MKDKITYHMYNRRVSSNKWEIIFYNQDMQRIRRLPVHRNNFKLMPGKPVSPMDVYDKTKGTMGY